MGAAAQAVHKKPKMSKAMKREAGVGILFALPWFIGFAVFIAYPVVSSLLYSFTSYDMFNWNFVGFRNYIAIFKNELFYTAIINTLIYTVISVPMNLILGVLMGLLLAAKTPFVRFYRTIYYLPNVLSIMAVVFLWTTLFQANGPLNQILEIFGIEGPLWLTDRWSQIPALLIMNAWSVGGVVIIFLAAIKGVPESLYEAARLDVASLWTQFWKITMPSISPTLFFNFIMGFIGSFQTYINAMVLTGGGTSTGTYGSYFLGQMIYERAFVNHQMGYASALSWIMLIVLLLFTIIVSKISNRFVFYMGE